MHVFVFMYLFAVVFVAVVAVLGVVGSVVTFVMLIGNGLCQHYSKLQPILQIFV